MATFQESMNVILVSLKFFAFSDILWRVMGEELLQGKKAKPQIAPFCYKDERYPMKGFFSFFGQVKYFILSNIITKQYFM